jgi:glycosyltransferase involved in cell wall biosynthesis
MSKYLKEVSLITTLFNESKNIIGFLQSYKNQTKYADEFIIVDGGSSDGTDQIIQDYSMKHPDLKLKLIVDNSCSKKFTKGPIAKGRNVAIENARNDIIAVVDAGCLMNENWLEEISRPFSRLDVEVVSGWYEAITNNQFQKLYVDLFMPKLESLVISEFLPSSRSIAFRKKCWQKVGGYPTLTHTAEDTKFDLNLLDAGFSFTFAEKAVVFWECPSSLLEARIKHFNYAYGDGQYRLFKRHYIKQLIHLFVPISCLMKRTNQTVGRLEFFKFKYLLTYYSVMGYSRGVITGTK